MTMVNLKFALISLHWFCLDEVLFSLHIGVLAESFGKNPAQPGGAVTKLTVVRSPSAS